MCRHVHMCVCVRMHAHARTHTHTHTHTQAYQRLQIKDIKKISVGCGPAAGSGGRLGISAAHSAAMSSVPGLRGARSAGEQNMTETDAFPMRRVKTQPKRKKRFVQCMEKVL